MNIKHVKGEFKVKDLSTNKFDDLEATISILKSGLEESIKEMAVNELFSIFLDDRINIYLPQVFHENNELNDPLNVVLRVDYSNDDNDSVVFEFSLREMLLDNANEKEFSSGNSVVSGALRKLADEIDNSIASAK